MQPRGSRLACSLTSMDGCRGSFDAYPGAAPKSIEKIEPVRWDKAPQQPVHGGMFSLIGDMGMTGELIRVNAHQWRSLTEAGLEKFFYVDILCSGHPFKVIEDAQRMTKKS